MEKIWQFGRDALARARRGAASLSAGGLGAIGLIALTSAVLLWSVDGALAQSKTPTFTTIVQSSNPSQFGGTVIFSISVQTSRGDLVTGTVTVTDQTLGQSLGTVTLIQANGVSQAQLPTSTLALGSHSLQFSYSGDANFAPSSNTVTHVVNKADTVTQLNSGPNPSPLGGGVTLMR